MWFIFIDSRQKRWWTSLHCSELFLEYLGRPKRKYVQFSAFPLFLYVFIVPLLSAVTCVKCFLSFRAQRKENKWQKASGTFSGRIWHMVCTCACVCPRAHVPVHACKPMCCNLQKNNICFLESEGNKWFRQVGRVMEILWQIWSKSSLFLFPV